MAKASSTPVVQPAIAAPAQPWRTLRLGVAMFVSFVTHAVLLVLFLLVAPTIAGPPAAESDEFAHADDPQVLAEAAQALPDETFDIPDVNLSNLDTRGELTNDSERRSEVTVPGRDDPRAKIGARDGLDSNPPSSYPTPTGFGPGHGGADRIGIGPGTPAELPGGDAHGRSDYAHRLQLGDSSSSIQARQRGATSESEAAVARGLMWLARQQTADGRWLLDGMFKDKGAANDTAGTGLGLLPFLGAGKTHKASKGNVYEKTIGRGLRALISRQDPKRGDLGGGMYGHGIGTIALCEAYGLTQDPNLRLPAQRAVNFIVYAQNEKGGWRYSPGQEGDLSVTGWQVMALKSAQMAGLDVPVITLKKADRFLDSVVSSNDGYGYTDTNATPTMSAVGLLCRQFMHGWGPQNIRLIRGINGNIKPTPPHSKKDAYYHYYATQVMYHFGGEAWKEWNQKMRDGLHASQEKDRDSPNIGSWSSAGDQWGTSGGRLMITSLNLLTLEVYYRYLPLYYRDMGAKK
jgi:hypothetical protein